MLFWIMLEPTSGWSTSLAHNWHSQDLINSAQQTRYCGNDGVVATPLIGEINKAILCILHFPIKGFSILTLIWLWVMLDANQQFNAFIGHKADSYALKKQRSRGTLTHIIGSHDTYNSFEMQYKKEIIKI